MNDSGPTTAGLLMLAGITACAMVILVVAYTIIPDGDGDVTIAYTVPVLPACEEDELIAGFGEYDSGYWTEYQCTHSDTHTCMSMYAFLERTYGPGILNPAQLSMISLFYESLGCELP